MATGVISIAHRRVVSAIVALIIPHYPELVIAARAQVHADVTAFVVSQISSMPTFLRFPYKVALTGFTWLPVLRHGRTFNRLETAAQARYLSLWSDAPIGVLRNFVKLIRSCALLAYFDHPLVMRHLEAEHVASHHCAPVVAAI